MSQFSKISTPTLPLLGLSEQEQSLIRQLQANSTNSRSGLELSEAYYLGEQVVDNLRIAIPKELEFIRPALGWGAQAVDPYVERLNVDGFRLPDATDADTYLGDMMTGNGFSALQSLAFTDMLSMSRSFWCVGSPVEKGDIPLLTVESPLNVEVLWDLMGITPRAVLMEYVDEDQSRRAVLMVPRVTIHLAVNDKGEWVVAHRDEHGFDFVPIVRMPNRPRTHARNGRSEISTPLRYLIQAACRTLLGLEVSREFYSVPQKVILGATEADFQKADGTIKSAFETYISAVLALERDENGDIPEIKQMQAYDPSVFTKVLDWLASSAGGILAATPQDLGLYTQGNPASADAVVAGEARRNRRARNMQSMVAPDISRVGQMMVRFDNNGALPDKYRRLALDWTPVEDENPAVTSQAVAAEINAQAIPANSDVVLKRLGYSAVERLQLAQDRQIEQGMNRAQRIIDAVGARNSGNPAGE